MSSKPRKKYRPRPVNPVAAFWTLSGHRPIAESGDALQALIFNAHESMLAMTKGNATRHDLEILASACNITEAANRTGLVRGAQHVTEAASQALQAVAKRGRLVLRGEEIQALNTMLEMHDCMLGLVTYAEFERLVDIIKREAVHGHPSAVAI